MGKNFSFGELFGSSWDIFKSNFKLFAFLAFVFSFIPSLIYFYFSSGESIDSTLFLPLAILIGITGIILTTSVLYFLNSKKKKMKFGEAVNGGLKFLVNAIVLNILMTIFLILLFILLIIPGIIFAVFWAFAFNILIAEKKSPMDSLRGSREVVRGNWWKVLGYFLLLALVIILVSIIPAIAVGLFGAIGNIVDIAVSSLISVFAIIFSNNFYLALKKKK
jgi:hypothetical protein